MARIPPAALPDDLPVHNELVAVLHTNPDLFRGFGSLAGRVHSASHLSERTRFLVVLRIVGSLGSEFQWQQYARAAADVGLTADDLAGLRNGDLSRFDEREQAVLRLAEAVEGRSVDDALWAAARRHLDDVELLDLSVLAGFYGLAARVVLALDIGPGSG